MRYQTMNWQAALVHKHKPTASIIQRQIPPGMKALPMRHMQEVNGGGQGYINLNTNHNQTKKPFNNMWIRYW